MDRRQRHALSRAQHARFRQWQRAALQSPARAGQIDHARRQAAHRGSRLSPADGRSGNSRRGDALSRVAPAHRSDSRQKPRGRGDDQQVGRDRAESRPRHRRDGSDGRLLDARARRRGGTRSRLLAVRMDVLTGPGNRRRHLAHPKKHNRRARPKNAQIPLTQSSGTPSHHGKGLGVRSLAIPRRPRTTMDFGLSEEQQQLKESARAFLSGECPTTFVRKTMATDDGYPRELYDHIAKLGWPGLIVPEKFGGAGLGMLDMAMVLEEGGYAAMPGPFLFSSVLAASALKLGGSDQLNAKWLTPLAEGKAIGTVAVVESAGSID